MIDILVLAYLVLSAVFFMDETINTFAAGNSAFITMFLFSIAAVLSAHRVFNLFMFMFKLFNNNRVFIISEEEYEHGRKTGEAEVTEIRAGNKKEPSKKD